MSVCVLSLILDLDSTNLAVYGAGVSHESSRCSQRTRLQLLFLYQAYVSWNLRKGLQFNQCMEFSAAPLVLFLPMTQWRKASSHVFKLIVSRMTAAPAPTDRYCCAKHGLTINMG